MGASVQDLRKLLADLPRAVIVAQRLTGTELRLFENERGDSDAAVRGAIVNKEELRFRRLGAG